MKKEILSIIIIFLTCLIPILAIMSGYAPRNPLYIIVIPALGAGYAIWWWHSKGKPWLPILMGITTGLFFIGIIIFW